MMGEHERSTSSSALGPVLARSSPWTHVHSIALCCVRTARCALLLPGRSAMAWQAIELLLHCLLLQRTVSPLFGLRSIASPSTFDVQLRYLRDTLKYRRILLQGNARYFHSTVEYLRSTVGESSKYRRVLLKYSSVLALVPLPFIGSTVR